jgi:23S rRNA pseudouridine1911/1915/1917 synthase
MEKELVVNKDTTGERLDRFLSNNLDSISRTKIHALIEKGAVSVDGEIKKPSYRLKEKELVSIKTEDEKKDLLQPFEFTVKIIYEDNDIIVVDKPTDLVVHPPYCGFYNTLVNALIYMKKELSTINPYRPGVVHRLDKETSGVMVLAKNNRSHLNLVEQFRQRKIRKDYLAIVWGKVEKDRLAIDLPLKRDEKNRLKMKVSFLQSKKAYTEFEVRERFKDSTLLSLKLLTGRMHQLRVHLKFLEFPIVGDKKYGIKDDCKDLFLHAYKLGLYHPQQGNFIEFTSPIPGRFKEFIKARHV